MSRKLVLDSCVFLIYASHNKLYRLVNAIDKYALELFASDELLAEILKNAPRVIKVEGITGQDILEQIMLITTIIKTSQIFALSPDPKDNFLFDIALQSGSEVIVTKEKILLGFKESPVPIHDIVWFKQNFEVPL